MRAETRPRGQSRAEHDNPYSPPALIFLSFRFPDQILESVKLKTEGQKGRKTESVKRESKNSAHFWLWWPREPLWIGPPCSSMHNSPQHRSSSFSFEVAQKIGDLLIETDNAVFPVGLSLRWKKLFSQGLFMLNVVIWVLSVLCVRLNFKSLNKFELDTIPVSSEGASRWT